MHTRESHSTDHRDQKNPTEGPGFGFGFFDGLVSGITDLIDNISDAPQAATPAPQPANLHFGKPLEESYNTAMERCQVHVSLLCISYLEKNVDEEGLFRIPGSTNKGLELKRQTDEGLDIDLNSASAHDVASFLKMYLRELPEGLVKYTDFPAYCKLGATPNPPLQSLIELISKLPTINKLIFCKLIILLNKIASRKEINKMDARNLAVCLATNVIKEPPDVVDINKVLENTANVQRVFQVIVSEANNIWPQVQL
jgi:hypothetical protein